MEKIYHTIETAPKSIKNVERGNFDTPNRNIHDRSLFSIDTRTSIKCGRIGLFHLRKPQKNNNIYPFLASKCLFKHIQKSDNHWQFQRNGSKNLHQLLIEYLISCEIYEDLVVYFLTGKLLWMENCIWESCWRHCYSRSMGTL
jgi:hypothetical protein